MDSPAIRLAQAMRERASWSEPFRTTFPSAPPASRIDSSAIASPIGVRVTTTIAAMAWASASMPVCAVTPAGSP